MASPILTVPRLLVDSSAGALVREGIRRRSQPAVLDHLEGVLRVLKDRGWAQGEFAAGSGAVCLRQAVEEARLVGFGAEGTDVVAAWVLRLMVLAVTGGESQDLTSWNDVPGRTKAEALQLVEDAIVFARSYEAVA